MLHNANLAWQTRVYNLSAVLTRPKRCGAGCFRWQPYLAPVSKRHFCTSLSCTYQYREGLGQIFEHSQRIISTSSFDCPSQSVCLAAEAQARRKRVLTCTHGASTTSFASWSTIVQPKRVRPRTMSKICMRWAWTQLFGGASHSLLWSGSRRLSVRTPHSLADDIANLMLEQ
jgi:hypothetical protein